jgi:hypothetical protein
MTKRKESGADSTQSRIPPFKPVLVRARHDGWSADKQVDFIQALAESSCVPEASQCVGMTAASAYALRARASMPAASARTGTRCPMRTQACATPTARVAIR